MSAVADAKDNADAGPELVYYVTDFTDDPAETVSEDLSEVFAEESASDTIWSKGNNALRDLLVYLVRKNNIEEVVDSKVKAHMWENLIDEFSTYTNGVELVSKPQIVRKWHNWKQYNKARKKPHPFALSDVEHLTEERVRSKCSRLLQRLFDPLAVSNDQVQQKSTTDFRPPLDKLSRLHKRDFFVRRTGASAAALNLKRLEHEVAMESLSCVHYKWKVRADNQRLVQENLKKKLALTDIRLERARLELAMKRNECGQTMSDIHL